MLSWIILVLAVLFLLRNRGCPYDWLVTKYSCYSS
jgi:hypothetical protein